MRYYVMPAGIWAVFCRPFRRNLVQILGFEKDEAKTITRKSRSDYKSLIRRIPEFEKGDFLKINTISCAMLSCFICTLMRELGVFEYVSALCTLDFPMEAATKVTDFSREITMPEGAPYCDCVYRRKTN